MNTKFWCEVGDEALVSIGGGWSEGKDELVAEIDVSETRRCGSCEVGSQVGSFEVGSRIKDTAFTGDTKDGSTKVGFAAGVKELMGAIPGSLGKAGVKASVGGTIGSGPVRFGWVVDGKSEMGEVGRSGALLGDTKGPA